MTAPGWARGAAARAAAAWNRFWFSSVDPRPFGLARIGLAAAGLQLWAGTLPLVREFYTDAGPFGVAAARAWNSEWMARHLMPDALGGFLPVAALFLLWGLALGALLVGWRTRLAAWVAWLLTSWFLFRNPTFANGGDEVLRIATLYLAVGYTVLPPRARAYSLDRRAALREGGMRQRPREVPRAPTEGAETGPSRMPAWPLRLLQVQLCIIYVVAGFWKVVGSAWWDGTALWYALDNDAFSRFGAPEWAWLHVPFAALTITIAWWELLFPLLVAWSRSRRAALAFGVLLHGMILVTMNIGVFPFVMLGLYPAFLTGGEAGRLARLLGIGRNEGGQAPERLPSATASATSAASP